MKRPQNKDHDGDVNNFSGQKPWSKVENPWTSAFSRREENANRVYRVEVGQLMWGGN